MAGMFALPSLPFLLSLKDDVCANFPDGQEAASQTDFLCVLLQITTTDAEHVRSLSFNLPSALQPDVTWRLLCSLHESVSLPACREQKGCPVCGPWTESFSHTKPFSQSTTTTITTTTPRPAPSSSTTTITTMLAGIAVEVCASLDPELLLFYQ